jgi:hypothetical protein
MGLREFCDILLMVILKFGGHIGNGGLFVEISLIGCRRCCFFYFACDKRLYFHSCQGMVTVETF